MDAKTKKFAQYVCIGAVAVGLVLGIRDLIVGSRDYAKKEVEGIVKEEAQAVVDHPEKVLEHTNDVVSTIFKTGVDVLDVPFGLSLEEERDEGKLLLDDLRKSVKRVDDPEQLKRIQTLAAMFLKERKENILNYTFTIVDTPEVNAYALCGGVIQITSGMLKLAAGDNNALAFIIGHEIGHVINGHCAKAMLPLVRMREIAGQEAGDLSLAAFSLIKRGYSELQEYEADMWSYQVMRKNGVSKQNSLAGARLLIALDKENKKSAASETDSHRRPRVMENRESRVADEIFKQMELYWATHPDSQARYDRLNAVK